MYFFYVKRNRVSMRYEGSQDGNTRRHVIKVGVPVRVIKFLEDKVGSLSSLIEGVYKPLSVRDTSAICRFRGDECTFNGLFKRLINGEQLAHLMLNRLRPYHS